MSFAPAKLKLLSLLLTLFFALGFMLHPHQSLAGASVVAVGNEHTVAIKSDGSLWAWGSNSDKQIGATQTDTCGAANTIWSCQRSPKQIGTGFTAIAAGSKHTLALKTDGTLWAWGDNRSGQIGDNTTITVVVPKQIGSGFARIAAGSWFSLAIKNEAVCGFGAAIAAGNWEMARLWNRSPPNKCRTATVSLKSSPAQGMS